MSTTTTTTTPTTVAPGERDRRRPRRRRPPPATPQGGARHGRLGDVRRSWIVATGDSGDGRRRRRQPAVRERDPGAAVLQGPRAAAAHRRRASRNERPVRRSRVRHDDGDDRCRTAGVLPHSRMPRSWEADVNAHLTAGVSRHPNAHLIDWGTFSGCHSDWFAKDGFHVKSKAPQLRRFRTSADLEPGREAPVLLIADALRSAMSGSRVRLSIDGAIATITNDNPDKHNAFDDDMDAQLFEILDELARPPRRPGGHLAGRGQVVLVGPRRRLDRHHEGRAVAPRADAPRPPRHPAALGPRRAGDRRVQGLGDGRLVPAGAAVRHPHRGRGHALPAARGRPTA